MSPIHRMAALGVLLAFAGIGAARADVDRGADVFDGNCADCHSLKPGKQKKGPSLAGIVGRRAASVEGFTHYSDALRAADITWTRDQIDAYLKAPKQKVPDGKMKFDGLPDAGERNDLIDFLASEGAH